MPSTFHQRRSRSPFVKPLKRVPGCGPVPSKIILIGEKPGREEAERGRPFVGISGKYMDIFLTAAGLDRADVFVTNCTFEFTEYSKPTKEELHRDHDALVAEILMCDPEIIGLVGAYAVDELLRQERAEMWKIHGCPIRVQSLFGGELSRDGGWMCLPMLHPASCVHDVESTANVLDDFLRLGMLADHELPPREDIFPDPDYRIVTVTDVERVLSVDQ